MSQTIAIHQPCRECGDTARSKDRYGICQDRRSCESRHGRPSAGTDSR